MKSYLSAGFVLVLAALGAIFLPALPLLAQQTPTGQVTVPPPASGPATGAYYTGMTAIACPPPSSPVTDYFIPETYNTRKWNDPSFTLIARGSRGPYADPSLTGPLLGSHNIWTPAGAWSDRLITLFPLPLLIQPAICMYDGTPTADCPTNCPPMQGLQFCYPTYSLLAQYQPDQLPAPRGWGP